jgi:hypothetical protein
VPRPPLLDPRHYRIDDILRGPYTPRTAFGSSGEHLWAASPQRWGFRDGVRWENRPESGWLAPFTLTVRGDGQPIEPGDAISRPSHVTLHAVGQESRLQVTEDKFITADDVAVSLLSLRNPGDGDIDVRVDVSWGLLHGRNEIGYVAPVNAHRVGPPGDDLRQRLPSQSYRTLAFAVALAHDPMEAARRAARWAYDPASLRTHVAEFQTWFDENVPRFDCSDPWLTKLWYHSWQQGRRGRPVGGPPAPRPRVPNGDWAALNALVREQFENGDYAFPRAAAEHPQAGSPWPQVILNHMIGLVPSVDGDLEVRPIAADRAQGVWSYFAVENVPCLGRLLTIVWDDPAEREDAFHDGDKGFTVYADGRCIFHGDHLAPLRLRLPPV